MAAPSQRGCSMMPALMLTGLRTVVRPASHTSCPRDQASSVALAVGVRVTVKACLCPEPRVKEVGLTTIEKPGGVVVLSQKVAVLDITLVTTRLTTTVPTTAETAMDGWL